MKRAMLVINPSAGKEAAVKHMDKILETLSSLDYTTTKRMTEKEGDASRFADEACEEKFDTLISMGGDGTLNEVITGLALKKDQPTLGIIPLGTVNDFARALSIPMDPEQAIDMLQEAVKKQVDIGKVNGQYFMNIIALGGIAEAVFGVSVDKKTMLGPLAYMIEGFKTIKEKEPFQASIRYDDGNWDGEALLVLVALTNSVGGFEKLAPHAKVNDGKLHCFIIRDVPILKLVSILTSVLKGEITEDDNVEYFKTSSIEVSTPTPLIANVDGDEGDKVPLTIEVLEKHLEVFVPKQ